MSTYTPDVWVVLKISSKEYGDVYKVLGGWYGGYTGADSWKINSGITKIVEHEHYYEIFGYSGSTYECPKLCEKTSSYTYSIFTSFAYEAEKNGAKVEIVDIVEILDLFKEEQE